MLQAGDIITLARGDYRLRAQLACSAYGVVWRCDGPAGTGVALKLVNREQMARAQPALQERWVASAEKEIAFLASLAPWDGRHIVRLLDHGLHEGLPVIALELMETDLARHLAAMREARAAVPLAQILDWLGQVNQALSKVHQYGWLYLDLKPANVLMNAAGGGLKLADFGTNRLRGELPASFYAGTASWQAPEQFFPNPQLAYDTGTRTDYFALGAMFYYLVTGGVQLRFCADCGASYREHQAGGAAALLAIHGGARPPTLNEDEASLFEQRIAGRAADGMDATWCPAAGGGQVASAALALLRALLAADPQARPRHAVQISRMLAVIGAAMRPAAPPWPRPAPARSWRAGSAA